MNVAGLWGCGEVLKGQGPKWESTAGTGLNDRRMTLVAWQKDDVAVVHAGPAALHPLGWWQSQCNGSEDPVTHKWMPRWPEGGMNGHALPCHKWHCEDVSGKTRGVARTGHQLVTQTQGGNITAQLVVAFLLGRDTLQGPSLRCNYSS